MGVFKNIIKGKLEILSFILFLTMTVSVSQAQTSQGFVKEGLTIDSKILKQKVRFTIYLPSDYETSSRYYPIVYLLHGYTDNDTGWLQFGEANTLADEAIANREIPPMILAMPDAGVTWYINDYKGKERYEDFFIQEFIPYIESNYRVRTEKRYRGVAGLSMGGYGTLIYALKHPDLFSACVAFSAAVYTEEEVVKMTPDRWNGRYGKLFGENLTGIDRFTDHHKANSILHIVDNLDQEKLKGLRIYIDCGDDDFLAIGNSELHILLTKKKINHEYRVRDGGHSWTYWRTGLVPALQFIGKGFHQE